LLFYPLAAGEYNIQELSAPEGYLKDATTYTRTVVDGSITEITVINTKDETPPGSTVFVIKLNCADFPQNVNVQDVFNGVLPQGCETADAGVGFDVKTYGGEMLYEKVETDGAGSFEIFVPYGQDTILLYEYDATNPNTVPREGDPFVIEDVHKCPCRHTNRVLINIWKS
jgi:uncharacterized surface anchored protein